MLRIALGALFMQHRSSTIGPVPKVLFKVLFLVSWVKKKQLQNKSIYCLRWGLSRTSYEQIWLFTDSLWSWRWPWPFGPLLFVPELWNYRSALPCLAQILICKMFFRKTTMRLRVQCSDRACAQIVLGSRFDPWWQRVGAGWEWGVLLAKPDGVHPESQIRGRDSQIRPRVVESLYSGGWRPAWATWWALSNEGGRCYKYFLWVCSTNMLCIYNSNSGHCLREIRPGAGRETTWG